MLFTFAATWAIVAGALTCGIVIALLASAVVYKCVTSRRRRTPLSFAARWCDKKEKDQSFDARHARFSIISTF